VPSRCKEVGKTYRSVCVCGVRAWTRRVDVAFSTCVYVFRMLACHTAAKRECVVRTVGVNKRVVAVVRCGVGSGNIIIFNINPASQERPPAVSLLPPSSPFNLPSRPRYVFRTRANNSGNILTAASEHPCLPFRPVHRRWILPPVGR